MIYTRWAFHIYSFGTGEYWDMNGVLLANNSLFDFLLGYEPTNGDVMW